MSDQSEDENKVEQLTEIPRQTDEQLRQFIDDVVSDRVYLSCYVDEGLLPMVFMPLALGAAKALEPVVEDIGVIYAPTASAAPRSVNGHPVFFELNILHKDDWEIVRKSLRREKLRRQSIAIDRSEENDDTEDFEIPENLDQILGDDPNAG